MIVVIQTAFLGDLILSFPAIARLKARFPDQNLVIVCRKGLGQFLEGVGICDHAFEVTKGSQHSYERVRYAIEEYARTRQGSIELVACFHRSLRSLWFAKRLSGKSTIAFQSFFAKIFFFKTTAYPKSWPDAMRYLSLVALVDEKLAREISANHQAQSSVEDWSSLNHLNTKGEFPTIPLFASMPTQAVSAISSDTIIEKVPQLRFSSKQAVAIFPGSVWETKRWTPEGFLNVAKNLLQSGCDIFFMGSPDEKSLCESICTDLADYVGKTVFNLAGSLSVLESVLLIKRMNLVICNDSAAQHMSALVGTPCVSIFGPTTLNLGFRPWNNQSRVVQLDLACRPCGAHGHRKCPLSHHDCMRKLSSTQVLDAIKSSGLLNNF